MIYLTVVACLQAVAIVAVVFLLLRHQAMEEKIRIAERQELEASWVNERRELLTRIQRPEHVPVTAPADFVLPVPEPDEIDLVGTIKEPPGDE